MENTATEPLMQLSFLDSERDALNEAVADAFGETFVDNGWFIMGSGLPRERRLLWQSIMMMPGTALQRNIVT